MTTPSSSIAVVITGTVHGTRLELDRETGLADGQPVTVTLRLLAEKPSSQGVMKRAFGGWSDDPEGVDQFVEETRRLRDLETDRETPL